MGQEDEDSSRLGDNKDNRSTNDSTQRLIESLAKHKSKSNSRNSRKHSGKRRSPKNHGPDGDDSSRIGENLDNRSRTDITRRLQNTSAKHRSKSDSRISKNIPENLHQENHPSTRKLANLGNLHQESQDSPRRTSQELLQQRNPEKVIPDPQVQKSPRKLEIQKATVPMALILVDAVQENESTTIPHLPVKTAPTNLAQMEQWRR